MVRKIINKAISAVTTTLLAFTTLASAIPVTTYAAAAKDSIQKSATKITSKNKDKAAGYGTFDFEADSSGYTFSHSSNLKKAVKTGPNKDWIWEDRDQGSADDKLKELIGNAYIAKLNPDKSFWVEYSNVKKVDDECNQLGNYDVKVVFDNAGGSVSGAEGHDIAIFDGQLGAVRFRGYKYIRCTIYVYKHGTKTLISGADDKLHFRFLDIDLELLEKSLSDEELLRIGKELCNRFSTADLVSILTKEENRVLHEILKEHLAKLNLGIRGKRTKFNWENYSPEFSYWNEVVANTIPDNTRWIRVKLQWKDTVVNSIDLITTKEDGHLTILGHGEEREELLSSKDNCGVRYAEWVDLDLAKVSGKFNFNAHLYSGRNSFRQVNECILKVEKLTELGGESIRKLQKHLNTFKYIFSML